MKNTGGIILTSVRLISDPLWEDVKYQLHSAAWYAIDELYQKLPHTARTIHPDSVKHFDICRNENYEKYL